MRILILTEIFDPEPMPRGMAFAQGLAGQGHDVEVLTTFPNFPTGKIYDGYRMRPWQKSIVDGIRINRVVSYPSHDRSAVRRILTYLSFAISASCIGPWLVRRPDVIYVYHPPLTVSLPAIVLKVLKRAPVVFDIQDLWPDTLAATGMVAEGFVTRTIHRWARAVYRMVDRIVVLGPGFRTLLIERGVPPEKVDVIFNWCDEGHHARCSPNEEFAKEWELEGKFNVLFAGAMGPAQALDTVLDAAKICSTTCPEAQFVFVGSGLDKGRLERRTAEEGLRNVRFVPQQPMSVMGGIIPLAQVLLVHLKDEPLFRITIPSKTQAYLASGLPVIMAVDGDAADLILRAQAGIVVRPQDSAAMAAAVKDMATMTPERRAELGSNGQRFYHQELSMDNGLRHFVRVFAGVAAKRQLAPSDTI